MKCLWQVISNLVCDQNSAYYNWICFTVADRGRWLVLITWMKFTCLRCVLIRAKWASATLVLMYLTCPGWNYPTALLHLSGSLFTTYVLIIFTSCSPWFENIGWLQYTLRRHMYIRLCIRAGQFGKDPIWYNVLSIRFIGALLICYVAHRPLI